MKTNRTVPKCTQAHSLFSVAKDVLRNYKDEQDCVEMYSDSLSFLSVILQNINKDEQDCAEMHSDSLSFLSVILQNIDKDEQDCAEMHSKLFSLW